MLNQLTLLSPVVQPRSTFADLIPLHIRRSRLMLKGGFEVCEGLPDKNTRIQLLSESLRLSKAARASNVPQSDDEEVRGGSPARRFLSVAAGDVQNAFYNNRQVLHFLKQLTGIHLAPSGESGTYTYYSRYGDYLSIHRDVEICDVAVICCLYHGPNSTDQGGMLVLYPNRLAEPLSAIRATPEQLAVKVRLLPGQTIIMFGGIVPHAVLPMTRGQVRIVSVLCYRDMMSLIQSKSLV